MGFCRDGLAPGGSLVGKAEGWNDVEPRALVYPDYLHNFGLLFPVPMAANKKKKKKKNNDKK